MHSLFLTLSTIAAFISPVIGIYSIRRGTFQPQRMTRFLIFVISLLFVGTLYAQGDRNGIFIALAQLLGSVVIFFLSIKSGLGGLGKFDILVFCLAMLSLIAWQTTSNPTLGLFMSIFTDFVAFSPTLIKTWKLPHTEEWKFYLSDVIASTFGIFSITAFSYQNLAFPLYILVINSISVIMILLRRKRLSPASLTP